MPKTQNLRDLLTELTRTRDFKPKMLEQKVFLLWHQRLGTPLGTKAVPVSLSDGILKIYTQYPPLKKELSLLKERIIADLNAELGETILTDLRIEVRQSLPSTPHHTKHDPTDSKTLKTTRKVPHTDSVLHAPTTKTLEQIEQTVSNVTDTNLKTSLRQLFVTQSRDKS